MRVSQAGFALPTILIASVVMMIVLVSAVTAVSSINKSLDQQVFRQIAREASESGLVRAFECLRSNNYVRQWTISSALYTGRPCTGGTSPSSYLVPQDTYGRITYRSYYQVEGGTISQGDTQLVKSNGIVELLRPDNSVYDTIEVVTVLRVRKDSSVGNIPPIILGE